MDPSNFTQTSAGGKACVLKLADYQTVLKQLKAGIEVEEIPWNTFNVVEKLSHSVGRWNPVRPEHLNDEEVDELVGKLPRSLVDVLLPFQMDGLRFALRRGGRCLIADEMGLGKTLQVLIVCFALIVLDLECVQNKIFMKVSFTESLIGEYMARTRT